MRYAARYSCQANLAPASILARHRFSTGRVVFNSNNDNNNNNNNNNSNDSDGPSDNASKATDDAALKHPKVRRIRKKDVQQQQGLVDSTSSAEKSTPESVPDSQDAKTEPSSTEQSKATAKAATGTDGASSKSSSSNSSSSSSGSKSGSDGSNGSSSNQPISATTEVLPVLLSHRPVFPGLAVHCTSTDEKFISAMEILDRAKGWDRRIVAFLRKETGGATTQLMTNADDAFSIGCICRVETIEITSSEDGQRIFNSSLFPLYRVKAGSLTEADKDQPTVLRTVDTGLDVTSFDKADEGPKDVVNVQWMKGISAVADEPYVVEDRAIQELCFKIIDVLYSIANASYPLKMQIERFSRLVRRSPGEDFQKPDFLADFCAALCSGEKEIQGILEISNVKKRLEAALELLNREVLSIKVQEKISKVIAEQTAQRQKEFILQEQYKYIKKELGLDDEKGKQAQKFVDRANELDMPEEVRKVFNEELNKFKGLESNAGEYSTVKTYLDWLVSVPWGKYSLDKFDLNAAKELLDKEHYGLKDVKDRILEFIAVGKLSGSVNGKIICLSGPPGVGKTSIARSVASALNRKFDRFSVGGLYDASEIKGHRRTYVAAMPGRIVQALKKTGTQNPVILIDEIDKVGTSSVHGDPSAALLEVLDPEQNKNYQDVYLEVPIDISRILFICTANTLDTLPQPLKDRMEIIHIPGYIPAEKVAIAEEYLSNNVRKKSGLENANITLSEDAIAKLVANYTRESGVRGLNKIIEKIYRKIAFNIVVDAEKDGVQTANTEAPVETAPTDSPTAPSLEVRSVSPSVEDAEEATVETTSDETTTAGAAAEAAETESTLASEEEQNKIKEAQKAEQEEAKRITQQLQDRLKGFSIDVTARDLHKYVGAPVYSTTRLYDVFPPGVAMGLAYTPLGGVPLFVETVLQQPLDSKATPKVTRTGYLGEVMNESSSIAYSFSRMFMSKNYAKNRFFEHAVIHTHFPEGAVKKDGPSAGIAMATSFISLALNKRVNPDVCMTGEITLTGKVLQIGGLREKVAAAKTANCKIIVFPKDNWAEWEDLPELTREGMTPMPVSWYSEVFDIAFGHVDQQEAESVWDKQLAEPVAPPTPSPPTNTTPSKHSVVGQTFSV